MKQLTDELRMEIEDELCGCDCKGCNSKDACTDKDIRTLLEIIDDGMGEMVRLRGLSNSYKNDAKLANEVCHVQARQIAGLDFRGVERDGQIAKLKETVRQNALKWESFKKVLANKNINLPTEASSIMDGVK